MKITKIEQQVKNPGRYSVFIDGSFAFGITDEEVYTFRLVEQMTITEEDIQKIKEATDITSAKNYAFRLVSRKLYTRKEILDKLISKGYTLETSEIILNILSEYAYVNDIEYIKNYIQEKRSSWGFKRIEYELKCKGVSTEQLKDYFEENPFDNSVELDALMGQKLGINSNLDYKKRSKIINFFLTRGFAYQDIVDIIGKNTKEVSDIE